LLIGWNNNKSSFSWQGIGKGKSSIIEDARRQAEVFWNEADDINN
jgi:hypothetical protein